MIVFVYVTNLGIVHATQYRMNYGQRLIKDEEAYASLRLLNSHYNLKRPTISYPQNNKAHFSTSLIPL